MPKTKTEREEICTIKREACRLEEKIENFLDEHYNQIGQAITCEIPKGTSKEVLHQIVSDYMTAGWHVHQYCNPSENSSITLS